MLESKRPRKGSYCMLWQFNGTDERECCHEWVLLLPCQCSSSNLTCDAVLYGQRGCHDGSCAKPCFVLVCFVLACFILVCSMLACFLTPWIVSALSFSFQENYITCLSHPVLQLSCPKNHSVSSTPVSNLIEVFLYVSVISSSLTSKPNFLDKVWSTVKPTNQLAYWSLRRTMRLFLKIVSELGNLKPDPSR